MSKNNDTSVCILNSYVKVCDVLLILIHFNKILKTLLNERRCNFIAEVLWYLAVWEQVVILVSYFNTTSFTCELLSQMEAEMVTQTNTSINRMLLEDLVNCVGYVFS